MNIIRNTNRDTCGMNRKTARLKTRGAAVLAIACTAFCANFASAQDAAPVASPLAKAVVRQRADYRQQQWERLGRRHDRDSLIAAVLLGMRDDDDAALAAPIAGHEAVEQRLAQAYGHDADALFALALACQMQRDSCAHPENYDELVDREPGNAVNWLLLPNGAAPSAAQLHSAAIAPMADARERMIVGVLMAALEGQPAPNAEQGVDHRELALSLRRDAIGRVSLPKFAGAINVCRPPTPVNRDDCIALGRSLLADRSGTILSRMIGVVLVRRLEKGLPDDTRAKQLRAEYVWMGEQLEGHEGAYEERLQHDTVALGEWVAWQRAVERFGKPVMPPAGWIPKHPQYLLMTEERTLAPKQ